MNATNSFFFLSSSLYLAFAGDHKRTRKTTTTNVRDNFDKTQLHLLLEYDISHAQIIRLTLIWQEELIVTESKHKPNRINFSQNFLFSIFPCG